ncbi:DEAD/DEAH box helicase family protein, partial [Intestinibacter bartlettii]|uniref:DEAD/DEAH box helicase family protein n=2 Tax=Intestinibacter bartlettii TaxID=261299 RepID=UPI003994CDE7
ALVVAPTGAGKTKETIDSLKRANIKSIFIVPNALNVEQIKQEYSIPGAWGDIPISKELEKGNLVAVTWDKFGQIDKSILKDYIVILDEIHQTHIDMFRDDKINKLFENLEYTKGQIHITATPNKLNFKQYNYILEYEQEIKTNYNVFLYNKIDDNKIMDIASKSTKFALFKDDKKYLDFIKETVLNKNIDVITSKTRDFSKCYTDIVFNRNIGNVQGLCTTSVLVAGVNIYDNDITDIIIIGEKDIATLKQFVSRFRGLESVNVHIFNNYKEEYKVYSIEWLIQQLQEDVETKVYFYNKTKNTSYIREALHKKPITIPNNNEFYFNQNENKYKVNEIGIRNFAYTFYYNQSTIESYKELLGEYFSNIEIVKLDDPKNAARKKYNEVAKLEKEEILKELEQNKDKLVGAVKILTDKTNKKLENYLAQNKTDAEIEYVKLLDLGVHKYITINNIAKILNLYTKYVIENGFTYNIAWSIATKGNRARGKIFGQIDSIAYRKIEKKYKDYIDNTDLENRLYNQIINTFKPGLSYTTEHLEMFIEAFQNVAPINLTVEQLQIRLNNIFKIDKEQIKKCTRVDKLFLYKIEPTHVQNKRIWIFTIVDFTSLEDLADQNNWSEIDKKILKNLINKNIRKIDKEVQEIKYGLNVFEA